MNPLLLLQFLRRKRRKRPAAGGTLRSPVCPRCGRRQLHHDKGHGSFRCIHCGAEIPVGEGEGKWKL